MARLVVVLWVLSVGVGVCGDAWAGQVGNASTGRYAPTRPGDARVELIRAGTVSGDLDAVDARLSMELNRNRYRAFEPRRPVDLGSISVVAVSGRYAPTRPGGARSDLMGSELLETVYDGYRRLEGDSFSAGLKRADPFVRDFEGAVKRSLVKKLVVKPVKVIVKASAKSLWKVAVGSWLPLL